MVRLLKDDAFHVIKLVDADDILAVHEFGFSVTVLTTPNEHYARQVHGAINDRTNQIRTYRKRGEQLPELTVDQRQLLKVKCDLCGSNECDHTDKMLQDLVVTKGQITHRGEHLTIPDAFVCDVCWREYSNSSGRVLANLIRAKGYITS